MLVVRSVVANPGGFEPLTEELKVPCKTILLYVRGP